MFSYSVKYLTTCCCCIIDKMSPNVLMIFVCNLVRDFSLQANLYCKLKNWLFLFCEEQEREREREREGGDHCFLSIFTLIRRNENLSSKIFDKPVLPNLVGALKHVHSVTWPNFRFQVWRDSRRPKQTPLKRLKNRWKNEKSMMLWIKSKQIRQNRANPDRLNHYPSTRNNHQPHHPHPPLLDIPSPPPPEKWSPLPKVTCQSSRPRLRRVTGSMPLYLQLNQLFRTNSRLHRPATIWCPGRGLMMVAEYNRMVLMVRF